MLSAGCDVPLENKVFIQKHILGGKNFDFFISYKMVTLTLTQSHFAVVKLVIDLTHVCRSKNRD